MSRLVDYENYLKNLGEAEALELVGWYASERCSLESFMRLEDFVSSIASLYLTGTDVKLMSENKISHSPTKILADKEALIERTLVDFTDHEILPLYKCAELIKESVQDYCHTFPAKLQADFTSLAVSFLEAEASVLLKTGDERESIFEVAKRVLLPEHYMEFFLLQIYSESMINGMVCYDYRCLEYGEYGFHKLLYLSDLVKKILSNEESKNGLWREDSWEGTASCKALKNLFNIVYPYNGGVEFLDDERGVKLRFLSAVPSFNEMGLSLEDLASGSVKDFLQWEKQAERLHSEFNVTTGT